APGAGAEPDRGRAGASETGHRYRADPPRPRAAERARRAARLPGRAAGLLLALRVRGRRSPRIQETVLADPGRGVPGAAARCLRALDDGHARLQRGLLEA